MEEKDICFLCSSLVGEDFRPFLTSIFFKCFCWNFHPENFVRKIFTHFDQQYVFMFLLKPPFPRWSLMSFMNWWVILKDGSNRWENKNQFIPKKTRDPKMGEPKKGKESLGPKEKHRFSGVNSLLVLGSVLFSWGKRWEQGLRTMFSRPNYNYGAM